MKSSLCLLFCIFLSKVLWSQDISIIPKPVSLKVSSGTFAIRKNTMISVLNDEDKKSADFFNDYLQQFYGFKLAISKQAKNPAIRLTTNRAGKATPADSYTLDVNGNGIRIEGDSPSGTFYGLQSLIQLLPVQKTDVVTVPFVSVRDQPRFAYRGLHLDVGRHMFPVSFIKKYIDYIALHKMNYFHWHLTEDQGWRIEIKKYPNLTRAGAYRNGTLIGRYPGTGNDSTRYGGFYTQDEVKEVVKYASDRHVNVIPEIEMPGHASAALTAYPWLGCPNTGPYSVAQTWGVFDDIYCAGKDSTFQFLQDVLDEIIPLFPCKYVHIGGDEAPKTNWKTCPLCQKRIKDENLGDEHGLQSYFIRRMEKYINSKGKTIIGWDEILEGGLAPNAVVMSWRGEEGGIEAAKQNHQVVMTPGSYVYLDHSQNLKEDSVTIGGYTTIEKVYSYEPVPKELTAEQALYVMGAQGNVWTEYMGSARKVEYQVFPRISALSEVLWSPKESRNWADFESRLIKQFHRYELWGVNYSKAYYNIKAGITPAADYNGIRLNLETKDAEGKLKYKGSAENIVSDYISPLLIQTDSQVTGFHYDKNGKLIDSADFSFHVNKATGKRIKLSNEASSYFPGNGAFTLVDGIVNDKGGRTNESLGFQSDVEAVIDLNTAQKINTIAVHALNSGSTYTYPPEAVSVYSSVDGVEFKPLNSTENTEIRGPKTIIKKEFSPETARFVKIAVKRVPVVPAGKTGAGENTWLFLDELQIN